MRTSAERKRNNWKQKEFRWDFSQWQQKTQKKSLPLPESSSNISRWANRRGERSIPAQESPSINDVYILVKITMSPLA